MPKQELPCPFCSMISSRGTGLASHIRGAHAAQYAGWRKNRKSPQANTVSRSSSQAAGLHGAGKSAGLADIIERLKRQQAAIDAALTALREMDAMGFAGPVPVKSAPSAKTGRKSRMSPEGRRRLIAALKKRWATKKAAESGTVADGAKAKRGRPRKAA